MVAQNVLTIIVNLPQRLFVLHVYSHFPQLVVSMVQVAGCLNVVKLVFEIIIKLVPGVQFLVS